MRKLLKIEDHVMKDAVIIHLDKFDCVAKLEVILNDKSKFANLRKANDKTRQLEKYLSSTLRGLEQNDIKDSITFEQIQPARTTTPTMYILSKIHEDRFA